MLDLTEAINYPHWVFPEGNQIKYRWRHKIKTGVPSDRIWYHRGLLDNRLKFYAVGYGIENEPYGPYGSPIFIAQRFLRKMCAIHLPRETTYSDYSQYTYTTSGTVTISSTGSGWWTLPPPIVREGTR